MHVEIRSIGGLVEKGVERRGNVSLSEPSRNLVNVTRKYRPLQVIAQGFGNHISSH